MDEIMLNLILVSHERITTANESLTGAYEMIANANEKVTEPKKILHEVM